MDVARGRGRARSAANAARGADVCAAHTRSVSRGSVCCATPLTRVARVETVEGSRLAMKGLAARWLFGVSRAALALELGRPPCESSRTKRARERPIRAANFAIRSIASTPGCDAHIKRSSEAPPSFARSVGCSRPPSSLLDQRSAHANPEPLIAIRSFLICAPCAGARAQRREFGERCGAADCVGTPLFPLLLSRDTRDGSTRLNSDSVTQPPSQQLAPQLAARARHAAAHAQTPPPPSLFFSLLNPPFALSAAHTHTHRHNQKTKYGAQEGARVHGQAPAQGRL